ncbi:MAG: hypothetical protein ACRDNP_01310, partial [Gaiellaceae bacterium]
IRHRRVSPARRPFFMTFHKCSIPATWTPARLLVFNAPAFRALLSQAPRVRRKVVSRAALRLASSS